MRLSLSSAGSASLPARTSLAIALLWACALPVAADWIVLRDGKVMQTDGPWTIEGERLIFTDTEGQRVALAVAQVDLEASHQANGRPATGTNESTSPTDSEGKPAIRTLGGEESPALGASILPRPDPWASTSAGNSLVVSERRDQLADDALHLTGRLSNTARDRAENISLIVTLYDEEGEILEFERALLSSRTLGPQQRTNFRATFPDVASYSRVTFEGTVPPPEPEVTQEMVAEAIERAKADAGRRQKERENQRRAAAAQPDPALAATVAQQQSGPTEAPEEAAESAHPRPRPSQASTRLVDVRTDRVQAGTVVTVAANRSLDGESFSQFRLENPPRLVLRIRDVTEPYDVAGVRSPEIVQARAGLHSTPERGDEIHLVFELASQDVESSVFARGGQLVVKLDPR